MGGASGVAGGSCLHAIRLAPPPRCPSRSCQDGDVVCLLLSTLVRQTKYSCEILRRNMSIS